MLNLCRDYGNLLVLFCHIGFSRPVLVTSRHSPRQMCQTHWAWLGQLLKVRKIISIYLLSFSKNALQVGHMLTSQTWLPCSVTSPGTSWAWPSPCRRCPRRTRSTWASPAGWLRLWWPLRPARCSGCTRWRRHCQTATWCCSRGRRSQWSAGPAWCTAASGSSFLVCRQWRFLSGRRGW